MKSPAAIFAITVMETLMDLAELSFKWRKNREKVLQIRTRVVRRIGMVGMCWVNLWRVDFISTHSPRAISLRHARC